ncbi:glycine oxidase ThiO [Thermoleptolyngbya sp. PKUAC-SCTB121]|uniref:glycine oxidase ThiO n=1 Tax=Thermoleptolyngbya sp. PKUAC-SCTB121 TaxID=2811482 RepID=UPI001966B727|nr:glycine oxidase ThiO [Thermoleptolyngbya sp. PKUAC-SCTB121]
MNSASDVLIIGGGAVGLAIAVELRLRGVSVTLLSRDFKQAASHAAAGMLAPHAEHLDGPMLDLCLQSRALYPDWTQKLEDLTGQSTGYWPCGILSLELAIEGSSPRQRAHLPSPHSSPYLDTAAIHLAQPGLGDRVVGGWWYAEDGQVDNRALTLTLRLAAESLGVEMHEGVEVLGLEQRREQVVGVQTSAGLWRSPHYILATGAWSRALLPVPVQPRKGQMFSVTVPSGAMASATAELPLQQVLYAPGAYIVPRRDGRIVVGATSEPVGFMPGNTPAGLNELLAGAIAVYPALQHFPIQETWWGFRPATPDEMPILGPGPCDNLTLAVGHYRNGILLTPMTARLIADWVCHQQADPLLAAFSWQRFQAGAGLLPAPVPQPPSSQASPPPLNSAAMIQTATPADPISAEVPIASTSTPDPKPLIIAGREFRSRLMTGTGKYANFDLMRRSIAASGSEIVTVAVRRVQTNAPGHEGLGEALDWKTLWMLPNTAGCKTAEEAIRVARLGREMAKLLGQEDNNFVKLEVIPDAKYLLPDPIGTLQAAEQLVKEGFAVLPYINADPLLAKRLEEAGCATVMPLGSPIGSGQGIRNAANIQIIIENASVPVVVDAGIGAPSEAAQAMEMGADALLINTAIAQAQDPVLMGHAMGLATQAGRLAYLSGRIPVKSYASASSPLTGTVTG